MICIYRRILLSCTQWRCCCIPGNPELVPVSVASTIHYIRAQLTQMLHLQVKPTRRPSLVSWNFYHVPSHNHPPHKRPGHRRLYVAIRRAILEPGRVNLQSVKRLRLAVARTAAHCCAVGG